MPSTISPLLTPRVSFCAIATPARATAPASTHTARAFLFIVVSLSWPAPRGASGLPVHAVDDVPVLRVHETPLQLHGGRQLLVLGGEDLLDEVELLDGLHAGELLVHPLDLRPDEVLDLPGPAERGEVGEGD